MRPLLMASKPATARNRVVLPQPDGPISTPICPGLQAKRHLLHRRPGSAGVLHAQLLKF